MSTALFKSFCVVLIVAGIAIGLCACVMALMSIDANTHVHQTWLMFVAKAVVCAALIAMGANLFDHNPFRNSNYSWSRPTPEGRFYKAVGRQ